MHLANGVELSDDDKYFAAKKEEQCDDNNGNNRECNDECDNKAGSKNVKSVGCNATDQRR